MTDVIEHFEKLEGLRVLQQCKERLNPNGLLMIVTPGVWIEQGAYMGNELETHRSLWTADDFRNMGFVVLKDGSLDDMGYMMIVAEYLHI
jgi:predicted SAM-dependent methyltransferase